MVTHVRENRMIVSNIITAFIFGYLFAIIYILCNGMMALITGNVTVLITDFASIKLATLSLNSVRIVSIVAGLLGVVVSQIFVLNALKQKKSLKRANTLVHFLQLYVAIIVAILVLILGHFQMVALLGVCVSILLCFLTGCQVNNMENKVGDMTYLTMLFVGNIQQIANLLSGIVFAKYISKSEYDFRDSIKKIILLITILLLYCIGLYLGAKMAVIFGFDALAVLPIMFLIPLIIAYRKR